MRSSASHGRKKSAVQFRTLGVLLAGVLLPVLAGCPGTLGAGFGGNTGSSGGTTGSGGMTGGGSGGTGVPACDALTTILQKESKMGGCLGSLCHTNVFPPNLSGPAAGLKAALMAGKAIGGACAGQSYVNTADPAASVILKRVQGMDCGERMPSKMFDPTLSYLSDADIACIASWVAAP